MQAICRGVLSNVYSTALSGSVNWPWSVAMQDETRAQEAKILRLAFRSRMYASESWVGCGPRTAQFLGIKRRKMGLVDKIWMTVSRIIHDREVLVMRALRSRVRGK